MKALPFLQAKKGINLPVNRKSVSAPSCESPADAPAPGRARMSDVARAAGVSLVTVSRAINEPGKVKPDTLATVRAVMEQLGYVPNLIAGSLASNRSRIIAAIVPTISNLVFSETIDALAQTLAEGGYQLLLGQSGYRPGDEAALVDTFLGRRVDGLVLTGIGQSPALQAKLRQAGIPVVQTWDLPERKTNSEKTDAVIDMVVGFSNFDAGYAAAEHLLQRGHRTLAFIGAEEARSRERLGGFRAAASAHGVDATTVQAELIRPPAFMDEAAPRLARIIARSPGVSAVFCNNDLLATGALFECQRRGWAVPERIAIMGFGDLAAARAAYPKLSTILIRRAEMGECAGQLLLARFSGRHPDTSIVDIGFEVIVRSST